MKKIGRTVCQIRIGENNARNGEGSFLRLRDGRILFGYTEYRSDSRKDNASARLVTLTSSDEGEHWENKRVLTEPPPGATNVMSLSFLRMNNGDAGAFYLRNDPDGNDAVFLIRSADEGETWSEPLEITAFLPRRDFYVLNNHRVLKLPSGRILFAACMARVDPAGAEGYSQCRVRFFCSDDDGGTWRLAANDLIPPFPEDPIGYQEPGLYRFPDGRLWCYIRTALGCQFESFSDDDGATWSVPRPNFFFSSPISPMLVADAGQYTVALYNPVPRGVLDPKRLGTRSPYLCAVSDDRGRTFRKDRLFYLEDDPRTEACYPAMIEVNGGFLAAYYCNNGAGHALSNTKIVRVDFDEIRPETE